MTEEIKKIKLTKSVKSTPKKAIVKKTPAKKVVAKTSTTKKIATKSVAKSTTKTLIKRNSVGKKTITTRKSTKRVAKKVTFFTKCINNLNFIKFSFLDVFLLFKNIIHWNISKVIILFWSIILGFISIIPLLIIFFIYTFFSDVSISMLIEGMFTGVLLPDFLGNIILLLMIAIYFIVFSYSNILLIRLNNSYKNGKKLNFKENEYFNIKKIIKYFNLTLLNISILLIPIFVFAILMLILFLFSGSLNDINTLINSGMNNYFSIFSLIFLILSTSVGIYLYYRIIFSYFILSDDKFYKENKSALSYIKESFNKTKKIKKFGKFIVVIIIFIVLTLPINYIGKVFENNSKILNDYNMFSNLTEEQKTYINTENLYYFETLEIKFSGLSKEDIKVREKQNYIYSVLFTILNFIFLYGLFVMIFSSFYKRELA